MKRVFPLFLISLSLALAGCVGHPADDEDDPSTPGGATPGAPVSQASLLLDFTATWCVNCPRMAAAVEEAAQERPGKVIPVSIHYHDAFACPEGEALAGDFGVQAYPSLIVDLSPASLLTATSKDLILARMDATTGRRNGRCSLDLTLDTPSPGQFTLHAEATVSRAGAYKLGALLLEDGVTAPQTGGSDNYVHDNILRKTLSGSIAGEDLGSLSPGASARKDFSFSTDGAGRFHVVAYVTDGELVQTAAAISLP